MLGLYAATGYEMPNIDPVLAKKHLTTALEKGSTEAAIFLSALEQKQGNHTQAIAYLKLANKRNPNPSIQTLLAFRLMRQDPTPENCTYCMDLLLQAAQSQYAPALYLLGHYTLQGKMNPPEQPIAYFRRATEIKPFPAAAYAYGDCLFCGKGGAEQSSEKAAVWIKMAANGSYVPAQWRLAEMYNSGIGLPMDKAKANEWAQRANKADSRPRMDTL
jgi:TPR repeat protein